MSEVRNIGENSEKVTIYPSGLGCPFVKNNKEAVVGEPKSRYSTVEVVDNIDQQKKLKVENKEQKIFINTCMDFSYCCNYRS